MSNSEFNFVIYVGFFVLIFGGAFLYKGCAPQSGLTSRFGGKAIVLEKPDDCKRVINMGRGDTAKYIVYETFDGDVKLKEYSDYGILEAEYIVPKGAVEREGRYTEAIVKELEGLQETFKNNKELVKELEEMKKEVEEFDTKGDSSD
jgi:hypothetical protein